MSRTRLTWIVVGGVATLLFVAGVDAFRSSDIETAAPPTRVSTTVVEVVDTLPPCTRRQVAVSIEVPKGVAVIVVRHVAGTPCHQVDLDFRLTIRDRAGNRVRLVPAPPMLATGGDLAAGSRQTFPLPIVPHCPRRGPFVALATVGPYSARRGNLSRSEIACAGTQGSVNRLRAEYIAQAVAICTAATTRFGSLVPEALDSTELTELEAWSRAAARTSEEALTKLRALPPPEADRARVKQVLSLMEQQTDVLRQLAVAASAGDTARVRMLSDKRIRLTHEKDGLVFRLAVPWGVSAEALSGCPVSLPA